MQLDYFDFLHEELYDYLISEFIQCKDLATLSCTNRNHKNKIVQVVSKLVCAWTGKPVKEVIRLSERQSTLCVLDFLREVSISRHGIRRLSCGNAHTAIISRDSKNLFVFGQGTFGQLGNGAVEDQIFPKEVKICTESSVKSVACGYDHTTILTEKREVLVCGAVGQKQGEPSLLTVPRKVITDKIPVKTVGAGRSYSAILLDDNVGNVIILGGGLSVELVGGYGKYKLIKRGRKLHEKVGSVYCGHNHLLLLTEVGQPFALGNSQFGKLGIGKTERQVREPEEVKFPWIQETVVQLSAGLQHSALITKSGKLFTFGCGTHGQLGNGSYSKCCYVPTEVKLRSTSNFAVFVACGAKHTIVNMLEGKIVAFGNCCFGQVGLSSPFFATNKPHIIKIGELRNNKRKAIEIAAGDTHSAIWLENSELLMFGELRYCGGESFRAKYSMSRPFSIEPSQVDLAAMIAS